MRKFIEEILKQDFNENYQIIFDNSELLQYIDKKNKCNNWQFQIKIKFRKYLCNICSYVFL